MTDLAKNFEKNFRRAMRQTDRAIQSGNLHDALQWSQVFLQQAMAAERLTDLLAPGHAKRPLPPLPEPEPAPASKAKARRKAIDQP